MRAALALACALAAAIAGEPVARAQEDDVRAFARTLWVEGVPLEEARRFDPRAALDPLVGMLADPAEEPHWANVVVILGMLGDERATDALLATLEAPHESMTEARWRAARSVPMALGYLVNLGHSERALAYLLDSLEPGVWQARGVRWDSPVHPEPAARDAHLTKMAMLGLALSGDPRAARALRATDPARAAGAHAAAADVERTRAFIQSVLTEHARIASRGLACYYAPASCGG